MAEAVEALRKAAGQGEAAVVGRIIEIEGFSTRPGDDIVAVDASGSVHGDVLAGLAGEQLKSAAASILAGGSDTPTRITVDVGDRDAVAAGLACGGRAHMVLQRSTAVPAQLWNLLASRTPAALLSRMDGGGTLVVDREGNTFGDSGLTWPLDEAEGLLGAGRSGTQLVGTGPAEVLVEAWVPDPRVVVVGTGELIGSISSQSSLLGWETESTNSVQEVGGLLEWAGVTGALVVLSHDPHIDTPVLADGLRSGIGYVGALGSRATQSRRTERLLAMGVAQADIDRIHRPVGLDLGGRRAPEVALAIVAEILASHHRRDARPLASRTGPIH